MNCEYCARTISRRKPFLIVSLGRKTRLGYVPQGPEYTFCSRACAARAIEDANPDYLVRVPAGKLPPRPLGNRSGGAGG